ncbi:alpha/beta fold hydrolase [Nocardioides sp. Soil805]|uniref:alpha/beta fold hydrolase n=1 Tax=Nocardioides sp. Soil805 TaxID=1736416 RepID=UPI0007030AC5|nr:alpha/beta fold hydrolase [Nocardioides sp. Soil805]KRF36647.1 alpha/beta hydrolase [Nocardioides sp. Soil805]
MSPRTSTLQVPTRDGGVIEVLTGGDPDGFGLLYHGGSPSAAAEYAPLDRVAADLGLRLVTYSRPGYGSSTPRSAPGRYVDDVEESRTVLDHLGIDGFLTLGWSGGGPRALACAALLPDRCRAAASLAGVAPYDAPGLDWFAGMAEENHAEYHAAEAGPEAYEAFLDESFTPILDATPEELTEAMGGLVTPVDREALTPEMSDWLARTFRRAGAQGTRGVRDDGIAAISAWGFEVGDIRVPVAVWQGRQDAMVPFAHGEWLAGHVPGAQAHLLDDEGHISLVHRLDEVLADLERLAGLRA